MWSYCYSTRFSYATPFHNGEAKVSFGGKNENKENTNHGKATFGFDKKQLHE